MVSLVHAPATSGVAPSNEAGSLTRHIVMQEQQARRYRQFVWTTDLLIFMSLLRSSEIDEKKSESDIACRTRFESSRGVLNLFLSQGAAENFPFYSPLMSF